MRTSLLWLLVSVYKVEVCALNLLAGFSVIIVWGDCLNGLSDRKDHRGGGFRHVAGRGVVEWVEHFLKKKTEEDESAARADIINNLLGFIGGSFILTIFVLKAWRSHKFDVMFSIYFKVGKNKEKWIVKQRAFGKTRNNQSKAHIDLVWKTRWLCFEFVFPSYFPTLPCLSSIYLSMFLTEGGGHFKAIEPVNHFKFFLAKTKIRPFILENPVIRPCIHVG